MQMPDRWVGGGAGFNFDAFDLRQTKSRFREWPHILVTNGSVYFGLEYDGATLPSTDKSGLLLTARIVGGSDMTVLRRSLRQRYVFFARRHIA